MSGRVKHLFLGKKEKDPSSRNPNDHNPPHSPRTPLSPGFKLPSLSKAFNHKPPPTPSALQPPNTSESSDSADSNMAPQLLAVGPGPGALYQPSAPTYRNDVDYNTEGRRLREKTSKTLTATSDSAHRLPSLTEDGSHKTPSRSSSQERRFIDRVKASKHAAQAYGGKAATTAKSLKEGASNAWDKLKTKAKNGKESTAYVPQSQYLGNFKPPKVTKKRCDVFGMDLKEATLMTRVISEMNSEADSAAYWIPALPFRCLQYLNSKCVEELGLYRVSGSTSVVDELRNFFADYHDVDICKAPPNDVHVVASLLKSYIRNLPNAILSGDIQKRVFQQCKDEIESGDCKPPQVFLDELSRLPPYNYYMLYSLTAHLSNVARNSEHNKMNLSNLGLIFCSTLRMDRFIFNWLVSDWSECWQGCWTEEEELQETDPDLLKGPRSPGMLSKMPSFDSRITAPSSPAVSQQSATSPSLASSSASHLRVHHLAPSGSPLARNDTGGYSVPPTPRSPREAPDGHPYNPTSFIFGDDQKLMVHAASDIIEDYVKESNERSSDATILYDSGRFKIDDNLKESDMSKSVDRTFTSRSLEHPNLENTKPPVPLQRNNTLSAASRFRTDKKEFDGLPELKFEGLSLAIPNGSSSHMKPRPPNISVPPRETEERPPPPPTGLNLILPPLIPLSPLIGPLETSHKDY